MGEEKDESFHGLRKEQGTETQALMSGPGHMTLDKPASWPVIWWLSSSNVYRLSHLKMMLMTPGGPVL